MMRANAVYSMTNDAIANQVVAFLRHADGTLTQMDAYHTGGKGTGEQVVDPLSSQGSLVVSGNGRFLFAVNAGSNTISSFAILSDGSLTLLDVVSSEGIMPTCLAVYRNILYVANSGSSEEVATLVGFYIDACGHLSNIPCAVYLLSNKSAKPSCLAFSKEGEQLTVSELSINRITVYPVCCNSLLAHGTVNNSIGAGPFGSLYLENGVLLVVEAMTNAVTSYNDSDEGNLSVISGSVTNGQKATCWIAVNKDQNTAYTSNAGTGTISTYDIRDHGELALRSNTYSNPNTVAAPLDSGVSRDGKYFYVLNGNEGSISAFRIELNGELSFLQVLQSTKLPSIGAQGLVVL